MESTPIEQIVDLDGANQDLQAEQKANNSEKGTLPEDKTEVSANQEENENDDDGSFFDVADQEEAKNQADNLQLDEIAASNTTNLKKIDSKNSEGPEEKVLINQINDYSEFSMIDKLDKNTYIT